MKAFNGQLVVVVEAVEAGRGRLHVSSEAARVSTIEFNVKSR